MARFHYLLAVILAAAGIVSSQDPIIPQDAPPAETSPSHPTLPGIAPNCNRWYTVKRGDTCYATAQNFGISLDDFFNWNPAVSKDCLQKFWPDYSYCIGVGTAPPPPTTTETTTVSSSTTSQTTSSANATTGYSVINPITSWNLTLTSTDTAWPPTKTQAGQPSTCNKWHLVRVGDTCDTIQARYVAWVSFEELLQWNPGLAEDCQFPFVGWWVCVGTQPQTSLSFDYPTSGPVIIPEPTIHTPMPTSIPGSEFTASPTQSGLVSGCQGFHYATAGDSCSRILAEYDFLTEKQLHQWNPDLKADCSGLHASYYYCVAAFSTGDVPMPPTVTATPTPTQMGTTQNCTAWYKTNHDDSCWGIAVMFGTFSEQDFVAWNPSVGKTCAWIKDDAWYCVRDPNTPPTRTAPLPTDIFPTKTPRQPNATSSCASWWFVSSGDTCDSIAVANGISLEAFYQWNPDVNTAEGECKNLQLDYEVCVGVK